MKSTVAGAFAPSSCRRPCRLIRGSIAVVLMVALAGCSSESVDTRHALENFKAQADEVARAVLQGDHKKTADLTHPALLEMMGGSRVIFHCRPHAKRVGTNEDDADVSPKLAANAA